MTPAELAPVVKAARELVAAADRHSPNRPQYVTHLLSVIEDAEASRS